MSCFFSKLLFAAGLLCAGAAVNAGVLTEVSAQTAPQPLAPATSAPAAASLRLRNRAGFEFEPSDVALFLVNGKTQKHIFFSPSEIRRDGAFSGELLGETTVGDVKVRFRIKVTLDPDTALVSFTPSWRVDKPLVGWEIGVAYQRGFSETEWRAQHYPFAGNSAEVNISPLRYCGIPGVFLYKPNLAKVLFYSIDSRSDYLNPTTWTGKTRFAFRDGASNPCFFVGGPFKADFNYEFPLQLFSDNSGKFTSAIPNIIKNWMRTVNYKVEPLFVRTPQEAFEISVNARRQPTFWKKHEGKDIGYEHHQGTPFVYPAGNPFYALFEYKMFAETGEKFWRDRAFFLVDFLLKGQEANGVFPTSYWFKTHRQKAQSRHKHSDDILCSGYCHWDWGHHAYKVDINAFAASYLLQLWKLVKETEGLDKREWRDAAVRSFDWILTQQNSDGGFPQCVDIKTKQKSLSTANARLLVALPIAAEITGDARYLKASLEMEKFLCEKVQNRLWVTGSHPDLPPEDYEQDSLINIMEYWLGKYERTGDKAALENAIANAYFTLATRCPKQLSWVKNPTQLAHSEQQAFNQYSVYSYNNRELVVLDKLYRASGDKLFAQLRDRALQNNFYTQNTKGTYVGSLHEAIADPWLERKRGFNTLMAPYTSELVVDLLSQLYDLGLAKPVKPAKTTEATKKKLPK
jgi:hypothetical protein